MDINITLEGLLLGALAIGIGLAFAFWGFRVFLILLPIWGFFAGFLLGANGVEYLFGDALPRDRDRLGRGLPAGPALRGARPTSTTGWPSSCWAARWATS